VGRGPGHLRGQVDSLSPSSGSSIDHIGLLSGHSDHTHAGLKLQVCPPFWHVPRPSVLEDKSIYNCGNFWVKSSRLIFGRDRPAVAFGSWSSLAPGDLRWIVVDDQGIGSSRQDVNDHIFGYPTNLGTILSTWKGWLSPIGFISGYPFGESVQERGDSNLKKQM
jgi:hypothetical protein